MYEAETLVRRCEGTTKQDTTPPNPRITDGSGKERDAEKDVETCKDAKRAQVVETCVYYTLYTIHYNIMQYCCCTTILYTPLLLSRLFVVVHPFLFLPFAFLCLICIIDAYRQTDFLQHSILT